jgi:hypothetical protein
MPITTRSGFEVNTDYQYEDNDIQKILNAKLIQYYQSHSEEIMPDLIAAVDNIPIGREQNTSQLTKRLQEWQNNSNRSNVALIPYNLGFNHWVGIIVTTDPNGNVQGQYIDPMNGDIDKKLRQQFNAAFPDAKLTKLNILTQPDITSCGAYTVENLFLAATSTTVPSDADAVNIRLGHLQLMQNLIESPQELEVDKEFYRNFLIRQKNNQPTAESLAVQLQYHRKIKGDDRPPISSFSRQSSSASGSLPISQSESKDLQQNLYFQLNTPPYVEEADINNGIFHAIFGKLVTNPDQSVSFVDKNAEKKRNIMAIMIKSCCPLERAEPTVLESVKLALFNEATNNSTVEQNQHIHLLADWIHTNCDLTKDISDEQKLELIDKFFKENNDKVEAILNTLSDIIKDLSPIKQHFIPLIALIFDKNIRYYHQIGTDQNNQPIYAYKEHNQNRNQPVQIFSENFNKYTRLHPKNIQPITSNEGVKIIPIQPLEASSQVQIAAIPITASTDMANTAVLTTTSPPQQNKDFSRQDSPRRSTLLDEHLVIEVKQDGKPDRLARASQSFRGAFSKISQKASEKASEKLSKRQRKKTKQAIKNIPKSSLDTGFTDRLSIYPTYKLDLIYSDKILNALEKLSKESIENQETKEELAKLLKKGKIYLAKDDDGNIKYATIDPQGKYVFGTIDSTQINLTREFNSENMYDLLPEILKITCERKHTEEVDLYTGLSAVKTAGMQRELANHLILMGYFLDNAMLIFRAGNIPDFNSDVSVKGTDVHSKTATTGVGKGFIPINPIFSKPKTDTNKAIGLDAHNLHEIAANQRETIQLTRTLHDLLKLSLDPNGDIQLAAYRENQGQQELVFRYREGKVPEFEDQKFNGEFIIKLEEGTSTKKHYARPWDRPSTEEQEAYKSALQQVVIKSGIENSDDLDIIQAYIDIGNIDSPKKYPIYYREFNREANQTTEKPFEVFAKDSKPITGDWDMFAITMPTVLTPEYNMALNASGSILEREQLINKMKALFNYLHKQAIDNKLIFSDNNELNLLKEFLKNTANDPHFDFEQICNSNFFATAGMVSIYEGLFIAMVNYIYNPDNNNKYFGEKEKLPDDEQDMASYSSKYLFASELLNVLNVLQHGPESRNPHAGDPAISSGSAGPYFIIYNGMPLYTRSEDELINLCLAGDLLKRQFLLVHFSNPMEKWHFIIKKQIENGQKDFIDPRTLDSYNAYNYLKKIEASIVVGTGQKITTLKFNTTLIKTILDQLNRGQPIPNNIEQQFRIYVQEKLRTIENKLREDATIKFDHTEKGMIKYQEKNNQQQLQNMPKLLNAYEQQILLETNVGIKESIAAKKQPEHLTKYVIKIIESQESKQQKIPAYVYEEYKKYILLSLKENLEIGKKIQLTPKHIAIIKSQIETNQEVAPIVLSAYQHIEVFPKADRLTQATKAWESPKHTKTKPITAPDKRPRRQFRSNRVEPKDPRERTRSLSDFRKSIEDQQSESVPPHRRSSTSEIPPHHEKFLNIQETEENSAQATEEPLQGVLTNHKKKRGKLT